MVSIETSGHTIVALLVVNLINLLINHGFFKRGLRGHSRRLVWNLNRLHLVLYLQGLDLRGGYARVGRSCSSWRRLLKWSELRHRRWIRL